MKQQRIISLRGFAQALYFILITAVSFSLAPDTALLGRQGVVFFYSN